MCLYSENVGYDQKGCGGMGACLLQVTGIPWHSPESLQGSRT